MNLGRTFVAGAIAVVIPLAAGAAGGQSQASDDAPGPFVKKDADQALQAFASQIEDNYLFPNLGKKYAELLRRKAAAGEYSTFRTDRDFTRAVEADLNAVQPDLHLHRSLGPAPRRRRDSCIADRHLSECGCADRAFHWQVRLACARYRLRRVLRLPGIA